MIRYLRRGNGEKITLRKIYIIFLKLVLDIFILYEFRHYLHVAEGQPPPVGYQRNQVFGLRITAAVFHYGTIDLYIVGMNARYVLQV